MEINGIDVSHWQGPEFNFELAKAEGFDFAILKAGGGDKVLYKDKMFDEYYVKCKLNRLKVGAYFFGYAKTTIEAEKEALYFANIIKNKTFEMPVFYDVEGAMLNTNRANLTNIIKTFCTTMESLGYHCGIYMSRSCFETMVDDKELAPFTHWVASWNKTKPTLKNCPDVSLWQYGGETNKLRNNHVAGVVCDQDKAYRDFSILESMLGFNGNPKMEKSTSEIVSQIIEGVWGNGVERKHLLELAGYDYKEIQSGVNRYLKGL